MKKTCIAILLLVFLGSGCKTTRPAGNSDAEKYVTKFLVYMNQTDGPKRQEMMDCIAPSYISQHNINTADYKVNNYSISGFSIESYSAADALVIAKVWGEGKKWIHQLTFKVVKEKGSLYLMPGRHSEAYIDPWFAVKTYVKE